MVSRTEEMIISKSKSLPWDMVERAINKEIQWLEDVITDSPFNDKQETCSKCIFRRMAILILSGKIKAKDIKSSICLWGEDRSFKIGKPHGKQWHKDQIFC